MKSQVSNADRASMSWEAGPPSANKWSFRGKVQDGNGEGWHSSRNLVLGQRSHGMWRPSLCPWRSRQTTKGEKERNWWVRRKGNGRREDGAQKGKWDFANQKVLYDPMWEQKLRWRTEMKSKIEKREGRVKKFRWNSFDFKSNDEFQDVSFRAQAHSTLNAVL